MSVGDDVVNVLLIHTIAFWCVMLFTRITTFGVSSGLHAISSTCTNPKQPSNIAGWL